MREARYIAAQLSLVQEAVVFGQFRIFSDSFVRSPVAARVAGCLE
jgi:hypothetical protein